MTVLALEYALRHPTRVSHLILMNPAPASASDFTVLRKAYLEKLGADMDRQRTIMASSAYKDGEPEAVAARYRLHFKPAFKRFQDYEKLMARMRTGFIDQGKEGIVKARAVEDRLMADSWDSEGYDLLPRLQTLGISDVGHLWGSRLHPRHDRPTYCRSDSDRPARYPQRLRPLGLSRMRLRRPQRAR